MVYGKLQTTFSLLTEETAIKWKFKVDGTPATDSIKAGMIVIPNSTTGCVIPIDVQGGTNDYDAGDLIGVAFDEYSSTLDYSQGSGYITVILGPHVGKTTQYDAAITSSSVPGAILYTPGAGSTAGYFDKSDSNTAVANLIDCDGTFLTYYWQK